MNGDLRDERAGSARTHGHGRSDGIDRPGEGVDRPEARTDSEGAVERGTVDTNGVETYYERRGEGPPVVFVHAAIMDHGMWDPQVEALSDEFTTVAYDVRGHGRTGGSAEDAYSIELFASDLDELVAALDLDRPVLVGLSTGGCIAQVYAARHPDRISGLVLADTFTPDLSSPSERLPMVVLRATVPLVRLFGIERVQRAKAWFYERISRGSSGDYDAVERLQAGMPTITTDEFAKVIGAVTRFSEVAVDHAAITAPTLIVYGEHTLSLVRRHAASLAADIPTATVRVVPGGGHASNVDDPEFFTNAVREFVERVAGERD